MSERRQLFVGLMFAILAIIIVIGSALLAISESDPRGATRTAAAVDATNEWFMNNLTFVAPATATMAPEDLTTWDVEFQQQLTAIAGTQTAEATPSP